MVWYEEEVKCLEEKIEQGIHKKNTNLFYGSSSFTLWPDIHNDFSTYEITNNAFGGSTLEACTHFFDRLVLPMQPKSLILYAGDNDIGDGKKSYEVKGYFERFYYNLRHYYPDIPFTCISIKPSPSRWNLRGTIEEYNGYIQSFLEGKSNCYFIDIYFDMLQENKPNETFFLEDNLHMSSNGYELWREKILFHKKESLR